MSQNSLFSERQINNSKTPSFQRNKMKTKKIEKCSTLENGLKFASWLKSVLDDSESSLLSSNEYLVEHLYSNCSCVEKTNVELLIGCNFYRLFLLQLQQFNCTVSAQESRISDGDCKLAEDGGESVAKSTESTETSLTSPYSNADSTKPSKFENEIFGHIVNKKSCEKIVVLLKNAIHYWEAAIKSNKFVDPKALVTFQIAANLIGCFYIFENFDILNYKYRSASLLLAVSHLTKDIKQQLHAYYLIIQACLQCGALDKAKSFLKRAEVVSSMINQKQIPCLETSLIFLAQCEIGLYSGNPELYAEKLKEFIESEYLQMMTLNRYYLKGLALMLAGKFPANVYQFSETFQEFTEPMQVASVILKRWHRSYFPMAVDSKKKEDDCNDPVWFTFAIYDFSLRAYNAATSFYINIGTPVDIAFFHNALLKIARRNCFLLSIVRLLTSAAEIDLLCDKKESAVIKLNVAAAMYINISSYSLSQNGSCDSNDFLISQLKPNSWGGDQNTDMENAEIITSPKQNISYSVDECAHDQQVPIWSLRKILMKNGKESSFDSDCNSDEVFLKSDEHSQMTDENEDEFVRFNFLKHDVYLFLTLFQDVWKNCLTDKLMKLHSKFNGITNNYLSRLSKIIDVISVSSDEVGNSLFEKESFTVELKLVNYLAEACFKSSNFTEIVKISETIIQRSNLIFGIEMKTLFSKIMFYYSKAKFAIYSKQSSIFEFNISVMNEVNSEMHKDCKTPSPKRDKKKQIAPKAPRGKNEFKMDEFKEYLEALSKASEKKSQDKRSQANIFDKCKPKYNKQKESTSKKSDDINDILKIDAIYSARKVSSKRTTLRPILKSSELTKSLQKPRSKSVPCSEVETQGDNVENVLVDSLAAKIGGHSFKNICSFEDIQSMVLNLLRLFGNHPPCQLYRDAHFLLFEMASAKSCNEVAAYHFSEATTSSSIRYRNILLWERKKKNSINPVLKIESLAFNPDVDNNSSLLQSYLSDIPPSWRICQLHAVYNNSTIPDIYLARYQFEKKPLFFKIKGNSDIFLQDFMSELYEIIGLSNASIANKDVQTFWKVRYALDNRFKLLMSCVDDMWFGPFKGLFMGQILDKYFCEMCSEMKSKILQIFEKMTCKNEPLLDMIIESYALLTNEQFLFAIITLFGDKVNTGKCMKECENVFHRYYPIEEKRAMFENLKTEPLAIIVNKQLTAFPFESLPTPVALNQEIFRVPSVRFLSMLYKTFKSKSTVFRKGIDPKSVYYLLNPSNNLPKTEKYFKEKFLKQGDWSGVIGTAPNATEFKTFLESKDLYIFFGHGAGSFYYRSLPDGLEGAAVKCASFVIGCCSGKLLSDGDCFEPYGIPWRFIMSGSPTYLGILWDVTDRDIDRFADKLLQHFLPNWADAKEWQPLSICNAVVRSRAACKLRYLIGASPVVYGLPISVYTQ